jgi:hypothetical protein
MKNSKETNRSDEPQSIKYLIDEIRLQGEALTRLWVEVETAARMQEEGQIQTKKLFMGIFIILTLLSITNILIVIVHYT